jgi:hypothetical protein
LNGTRVILASILLLAAGVAVYAYSRPVELAATEPSAHRLARRAQAPGSAAATSTTEHASTPRERTGGFADAERVMPHPITPQRERLAFQQRLFAGVEAALAARDYDRARELPDQHQSEFSGDATWADWRDGFRRIADCLEHPGPAARRLVSNSWTSNAVPRFAAACAAPVWSRHV